ncbi:HAD domain-containing protein [Streptomyces sp. NPDC047042]|uniref:HAD domain-containing protein n=1 Tax=Streptomyces sp. NPDC047042 TaxID=3154807 RepID=UPI0033E7D4A6
MNPPLVFLDVDGPLIPFGGTPKQYPDGYPTHRPARPLPLPAAGTNPLLPRINPALGPRLAALACELVWATTWMDEANEMVSPWLGLPTLPVANWPDPDPYADPYAGDLPGGPGAATAPGVHWKTRPLVDLAAGRDFVWLDDEVTDADRRWVAQHHPGRALLHRVDPRHGLRDADFVVVEEWLRES